MTIFDADKNVCWLIGYGPTHAKGEDRDVFNDFERLDGRGELLPTADDYELLETLSTAAQIDALTELGLALYEEARSEPGVEVNRTLGLKDGKEGSMLIVVDLEVFDDGEAEQGWIVFTIPPQTGIGEEQLYDVLGAILPANMDGDSLTMVAKVGDRAINYNELAWTWSCYPDA
ncbi:hypothetical protein [Pseudolysinimonas kribbensis]|uniref:hypothetical protein n=1 Tax=Pseudolysinimonas kribbensis TaxID=433641 RepID=UPI0024E115C9|nr:hypothetical protein [Pseudolysinimonas kribbensis]